MKKLLIISMLVMGSISAQAAKYDCTLSNGTPNDPKAITYGIDTATESIAMAVFNRICLLD